MPQVLASVFPPSTSTTSPEPYNHAHTPSQNTTIINKLLQSLISETSTPEKPPEFKFLVSSTIIQQGENGAEGKRGMHAASGAYWNNERDGMWSFKWEGNGGEDGGRAFDVVVSVVWVGVV